MMRQQGAKVGSLISQYSQSPRNSVLVFSQIINRMIVILTVLMIIIIVIVNIVLIDALYFMGIDTIKFLQQNIQSGFFVVLMNIISLICNTPGVVAVFGLEIVLVKHKLKSLMHISFFLVGFYFITVFKQAYQQSRPIWTTDQVNRYQWFCPKDYGDPSGHSYVPFPLYEPLISKYVGFQYLKVAWLFMLFFGIFVPFSRMYLGVHSMNQVFFGLSLGIGWVVIFRYGLRQTSYRLYSRLLKQKITIYMIYTVVAHICCLIVPLIIYRVNFQGRQLADLDIQNLNKMCHTDIDSQSLQGSMLHKCVLQSVVFGFLYGLYFLKADDTQISYFAGNWQYKNIRSGILHCLSMGLCAGLIPIIFLIIIQFVNQPYTKYFLLSIALTGSGFSLIYITPKVQRQFQWINYFPLDQLNLKQEKCTNTYTNLEMKIHPKEEINSEKKTKTFSEEIIN